MCSPFLRCFPANRLHINPRHRRGATPPTRRAADPRALKPGPANQQHRHGLIFGSPSPLGSFRTEPCGNGALPTSSHPRPPIRTSASSPNTFSSDHQRSNSKREQLAAHKGINLNAEVRSNDVTQKIAGGKGADFDKQYVERIAEAHDDSVKLFEKPRAPTMRNWKHPPAVHSPRFRHRSMSKQLDKSLN